MEHILVIEDDPAIRDLLRRGLAYENYKVTVANDGLSGLSSARDNPPDLVILDWMMPGLDGLEVCKRLRAASNLPILMLTAKDAVGDRVLGLETGADDYLTKPFSHSELVARLKALVRRNRKAFSSRWIEKHGLKLDTTNHLASFNDKQVGLTRKESLLLKRLMCDAPEAVSRDRLLNDVWEIDNLHTSNRLDVYVRRLRAKLASIGAVNLIHTKRGNGYLFAKLDSKRSLAEGVGFEPTVPLPARRFSRPFP